MTKMAMALKFSLIHHQLQVPIEWQWTRIIFVGQHAFTQQPLLKLWLAGPPFSLEVIYSKLMTIITVRVIRLERILMLFGMHFHSM